MSSRYLIRQTPDRANPAPSAANIVRDRDTTSGPLGYLTRATWRKEPTKARSGDQPTIPCHLKGRAIFASQIWQIAPKIVYPLDNPRIQRPRKGSFKSCIIAPWDRKTGALSTGALSYLRPTGVSDAFRQIHLHSSMSGSPKFQRFSPEAGSLC
ncbi:hypothetical protein I7I51_00377 [Histoplasma capsulatum]|uniref:Uncharacterized protein n=1 Tax=Ajellomyces capsulatus TaxID=5037 RepID=A0A8A1MDR2_AJECA|nr:hypothetical protein I7I51_00377 [Histoplasma capsulatum]